MKYVLTYTFFSMVVFLSSCGQNQTNLPKDTTKTETKDVITPHRPNTSVRTIRQDRKGNIWLASNEGIIRYDGKSFTNITGTLFPDRFFSVLEDRKGNFWFGNYGSGVYHYDGKSFRNFTTKEVLPHNGVTTILKDKTGKLRIGARETCIYDGKTITDFKSAAGQKQYVSLILSSKTAIHSFIFLFTTRS